MNKDLEMARKIAECVDSLGGTTYFVGGYVRDKILGIENEKIDIDIEIHDIPQEKLEEILDRLGERTETGIQFGVYGLKDYDLDIAMPRTEKAVGKGHRDFQVTVNPYRSTREAAMRRDFTVNALMENVLTGQIVDHFSGIEHIKKKILHHVNDETFADDPLRLFRGAQFAARFQYSLAGDTIELCKKMDVTTLVKERVFKEMKKALLKADRPSIFFEALRQMDKLKEWFPEVEGLIGVKQNPKYHTEGDVWVHTMLVLDQAAKRRDRVDYPLGFMLSALCHDFGKILATEYADGQYHAYNHEVIGLPLVRTFLERLFPEKQLVDYVCNMVEYHMKPHAMAAYKSKVKKTNKLFDESVEPYALIQLAECDARSTVHPGEYISHEDFLLERYEIYKEIMARPYVMGRDLVAAGMKPDKNFSKVLSFAHKLRLAGIEKEKALIQTLAYAKKEFAYTFEEKE